MASDLRKMVILNLRLSYRLYIEIQQLMEVENKLASRMGVGTEKTAKELIQCSADTYQLEQQSKSK